MTRSRSHTLLATVVVALLLAAGCSDDGSDDASVVDSDTTEAESTTTEAESTTTEDEPTTTEDETTTTEEGSTTTEDSSEAEALAEAVTLTENDFASDWTSTPDEQDEETLLDCFSDVDLDSSLLAQFTSPGFSQEATDALIGVSSIGMVLSDADEATTLMDEAGTNQYAGCALDFLSQDGSLEGTDLNPAPEGPPVGDQSVALTGVFTVTDDDGSTLDGELYVAFIRTDAVVSGLSVFSVGETDFATVVDETTAIIGDKQAAEVG